VSPFFWCEGARASFRVTNSPLPGAEIIVGLRFFSRGSDDDVLAGPLGRGFAGGEDRKSFSPRRTESRISLFPFPFVAQAPLPSLPSPGRRIYAPPFLFFLAMPVRGFLVRYDHSFPPFLRRNSGTRLPVRGSNSVFFQRRRVLFDSLSPPSLSPRWMDLPGNFR